MKNICLLSRKIFGLEIFLSFASILLLQFSSSAQAPAGYTIVRTDPEVAGRHEYTNFTVRREATVTRYWQHPTNPGDPFQNTVLSFKYSTIEGHNGRTIVYAIPSRTQNGSIPRDQRVNYEGLYHYLSDVNNAQKVFVAPLFYRPEGRDHIYSVKVTQQRWERLDQTRVDFLIVSYNSEEKLKFVDVASTTGGLILNSHLPAPGLYSLIAANNDIDSAQAPAVGQPAQWTGRKEKWKHLESDDTTAESIIEIRTPHGVLSIPGNGMFVLHDKEEATDGDVAQLKREMESAQNDIDQLLARAANVGGTVLVTGPTGCGKTSFINCYANNTCISRLKKNGTGWELHFPQPLANLAVGHGGGSQTDRPAFYIDGANRIALCDTPGDNDTKGKLKQIVNAYMVYRMFSNPSGVKLLLVIDESRINTEHYKGFIEALEDVVNSCTEEAQLHQMIHLMVSKHRHLETQTFLKSLLGDPQAVPAEPQNELLNGKTQLVNFVRFLADHPERLSTFTEAPVGQRGQEIPFHPDLSDVRSSILAGPFVAHPKMKIKLKDDCNQLIEGLARKLNEDMVKYLRTEGAQKILRHCLLLADDHNTPVNDLRNQLTGLATRLKNIPLTATPDEFVTVFDGSPQRVNVAATPQIFDAHEMKEIVDNLKFLKTILPGNVSYNIRGWKDALSSATPFAHTIGKIENLAKKPKMTFDNGTVLAKGILVGSSDVESFITERTISPTSIIIQALHTWFIDQNMTHINTGNNRTSVYAMAPRWKVTAGSKEIDLSGAIGSRGADGAAGTNGTDTIATTAGGNGASGSPGYTAGSFFGKFSTATNLSSLTVRANGGQGGDGGNGGVGGAGKNASDGTVPNMVPITETQLVRLVPYGGMTNEMPDSYSPYVFYSDTARRWRDTAALVPWVGGDLFHHQIEVHGRVFHMEHAPQGQVGMAGGEGGRRGIGGNAGEIIVRGPDSHNLVIEQNQGSNGTHDGASGVGGLGGCNGMVLRGTIWRECRTGIHETRNLVDRWHVVPALHAPPVARAASGSTPTSLSTVEPAAADLKVTIGQTVQDSKVNDFKTYYNEQAKDPLVSPFVRAFPGLEQ